MRDYGLAKLNILKNVTAKDHLIVGEESGMQWLEWAKSYPMTMHRFSKQALPKEFLERIDFSRSRLVGSHNQANFYCAFKVLDLLGLLDVGGFQQFVNQFKGVAHRLEFVREWQGLKIYNDAKSTNAQALTTALAAFESLAGQVHLVMGGKLRNENDRFLPALRAFAGRVETILLMGETARRLEAELNPVFRTEVVGDLSGLSAYLKYHEPKGVLVFSPGHPSFDQFKNYVDRGEKFKATMLEL
jgi:UDP-N-acetylmuramoylalanine--D-glutamate ligase